MKSRKMSGKIAILTLSLLASSIAMASDEGWYMGGSVGPTGAKIDDPRISGGLAASGLTTTNINDDNKSGGGKVFGGYQFNKNIALEGGYFNLGKFGYQATTVPAGTLNGNIKVQGLNLDLVGILPMSHSFSLFGSVGGVYAQSRDNFTGSGAVNVTNPNPHKNDLGIKVGMGLQYAFNDNLSMRGGIERYRINDAVGNRGDIDMVSIGLVYKFGQAPQAPVYKSEYVPRPQTEAVIPLPVEPVVIAEPVKVQPLMKVSFSADSLFDFNKAVIKPAGKQSLDKFTSELKDINYNSVSVIGHTDRIGSVQYNQKLSEQRAHAVKSYLMNAGIAEQNISSSGEGKSHPVTQDCKGTSATEKLVSCLAPDRRVEVEVTGTR